MGSSRVLNQQLAHETAFCWLKRGSYGRSVGRRRLPVTQLLLPLGEILCIDTACSRNHVKVDAVRGVPVHTLYPWSTEYHLLHRIYPP